MSASDRRRFLANADADAKRLALLVTRLLDLARADMTAPGNDISDADAVVAAVRGCVAEHGNGGGRRAAPQAASVAVPTRTLEAVLATLFENSRQAGASMIYVRGTVGADTVAVSVGDDGPGVAPADRARLFEPFFTTRRAEGGTGMGLAIARSLLEASGGTLTLEADATMMFRVGMPIA